MDLTKFLSSFKAAPNGCIEWTRARRGGKSASYGAVNWKGKVEDTHRLMWTLEHGPVPGGFYICHSCDNPICGNPAHLFLGTPQDNVRDMIAKSRHNTTDKARGNSVNTALLTPEDVVMIRQLSGHKTQRELARLFGVGKTTVAHVLHRRSWKHI